MSIKRIVDTGFWTDKKVIEQFSPEDKLFMLYLLTNPHTTQLGIYCVSPRQIAFEIGYSNEAVQVMLERFERKYDIIRYHADTGEVAIRNYLKYSIVSGGDPVFELLVRETKAVKNKSFLQFIREGARQSDNKTVLRLLETPPFAPPDENDNEDDNDNDNDDSGPNPTPIRGRFGADSGKVRKDNENEAKHKYGSYENVLLSDEQLVRLKSDFPTDWQAWIEKLSEGIALHGYKYKNHLVAIRTWARKDGTTAPKTPTKPVNAQQYTQRDYTEDQMQGNGAVVDLMSEAKKFMGGGA